MQHKVEVYDTSLRDGAQDPRIYELSAEKRVELASRLFDFGMDFVEGGWPYSNPLDKKAFKLFKERLPKDYLSKITAFGSTRRVNIKAEEDPNLHALVESGAETATIFGKTWMRHVNKQLRTDKNGNLEAIAGSVKFLAESGMKVFYDAEHFFDGFKDDSGYALECLEAAFTNGATRLILCDTNGGMLTTQAIRIVEQVRNFLDSRNYNTGLGIHCHNCSGNGTSVPIELAVAGLVSHIQGTLNGFGERTGNSDLCIIMPELDKYDIDFNARRNLEKLAELSQHHYRVTGIKPNPKQPYAGRLAFAHTAGVHADSEHKDDGSYQHYDPARVGNVKRVMLSKLSGRGSIAIIAKSFGYCLDKNHPVIVEILQEVAYIQDKGYDANLDAEQYLLFMRHLEPKEFFRVESVHEEMHSNGSANGNVTCLLSGRLGGNQYLIRSKGEGPVDAVYRAIVELLSHRYDLSGIKLSDYGAVKLGERGSDAPVRVTCEFEYTNNGKTTRWDVEGIHTNIIKASQEAIEKGLIYYLYNSSVPPSIMCPQTRP